MAEKRICDCSWCGYTARWGLHFVAKSASGMAVIGNDPVQVVCGITTSRRGIP